MSCRRTRRQRLLSQRVANDEAALLGLIDTVTTLADRGQITWAIDLNGGAALLISLLVAAEQRLPYIPGRTVYHAGAGYRGEGKTDAKDAAVIADQARMRRDLSPLHPGSGCPSCSFIPGLEGVWWWGIFGFSRSAGRVGDGRGRLCLAGRALQPLQDVTATARRVAERSLHERIALDGPHDEIKELADTFDAMLERLDHAFDGQRRFVANASHELRTPLAINRTLIEVALDDPDAMESTRRLGKTLLAVNQRHERLTEGLLVLASSEQRLETRTRIDLAEIAHGAVVTATDAAHRAGVRIGSHLTPAYVAGDPALLERLAQNLVDNAIRYNIAGRGWVSVTVTGDLRCARLTVVNTGPVIAPFAVDGLFEPFRRLAPKERITEAGHPTGSPGARTGAVDRALGRHGARRGG